MTHFVIVALWIILTVSFSRGTVFSEKLYSVVIHNVLLHVSVFNNHFAQYIDYLKCS